MKNYRIILGSRVLVWKDLDPGKNGRPVSGDHVEG